LSQNPVPTGLKFATRNYLDAQCSCRYYNNAGNYLINLLILGIV